MQKSNIADWNLLLLIGILRYDYSRVSQLEFLNPGIIGPPRKSHDVIQIMIWISS